MKKKFLKLFSTILILAMLTPAGVYADPVIRTEKEEEFDSAIPGTEEEHSEPEEAAEAEDEQPEEIGSAEEISEVPMVSEETMEETIEEDLSEPETEERQTQAIEEDLPESETAKQQIQAVEISPGEVPAEISAETSGEPSAPAAEQVIMSALPADSAAEETDVSGQEETDTDNADKPAVKTGWKTLKNGKKVYIDPQSKTRVTGMRKIGGKTYLFTANGILYRNRVVNYRENRYRAGKSGALKSGWYRLNDHYKMYFRPGTYRAVTGLRKSTEKNIFLIRRGAAGRRPVCVNTMEKNITATKTDR